MKGKFIALFFMVFSFSMFGQTSVECHTNTLINKRTNVVSIVGNESFTGLIVERNGRRRKIYKPFKIKLRSNRYFKIIDAYGNGVDIDVNRVISYNTKDALLQFLEGCGGTASGGATWPVTGTPAEFLDGDDVGSGISEADADNKYVTLATNQTITANKTFADANVVAATTEILPGAVDFNNFASPRNQTLNEFDVLTQGEIDLKITNSTSGFVTVGTNQDINGQKRFVDAVAPTGEIVIAPSMIDLASVSDPLAGGQPEVNNGVGINTADPKFTLDVSGSDGLRVPVGTTAQRPAIPQAGVIRFNSTLGKFEGYDGTKWVPL